MQYYGSKISENISKREPEGYLYCLNVPIARTGVQKYLAREVGLDGNSVVDVHRLPEEVFKGAAVASFEGMPITREHPPEEVDVRNISAYQKGHVQNVRRGAGDESEYLLADLVVTHDDLIRDILDNNVRDVSCGYEVEYKEGSDGKVYQVGIRGNHVAVVDSGRAGDRVAIRDSASPDNGEIKKVERSQIKVSKNGSVWARMFASFARDEAVKPEEVVEVADELFSKPEEGNPPPKKEEKAMDKRACDEGDPFMKKEEKPGGTPLTQDEGEELMALISELAQEVKSLKELVMTKPETDEEPPAEPEKKKELDPLLKLEEEVTSGEPLNEGAVTVPPEEIEVEDEDVPAAEPAAEQGPSPETKEAVVAAINELKPIIAGLPAQDRKRAADAASRAIRKAAGLMPTSAMDSRAKLAQMAARKRMAKDSAADNGAELGRKIMQARNPHYRNK